MLYDDPIDSIPFFGVRCVIGIMRGVVFEQIYNNVWYEFCEIHVTNLTHTSHTGRCIATDSAIDGLSEPSSTEGGFLPGMKYVYDGEGVQVSVICICMCSMSQISLYFYVSTKLCSSVYWCSY